MVGDSFSGPSQDPVGFKFSLVSIHKVLIGEDSPYTLTLAL
jgi:hypothetical protein